MSNDHKRYRCESCEAKAVANYGTHTYCHACKGFKPLTSDSRLYYKPVEPDEDQFYAHELAESISVGLEPSDLQQEWVSKRGYGQYELDYLQSHGDFGTITPYTGFNLVQKLQKAGGEWVTLNNWMDKIVQNSINNFNLVICRDFHGRPSSFQYYTRAYSGDDKKFYGPHRRLHTSMVTFQGNDSDIIFAGEGVATCLGVFFLLKQKYTCISFLDANSLVKGLPELMAKYPNSQIIVIGDDDYDEANPDKPNKGKEVAKTFAALTSSVFPLRSWKLYDWDDVYRAVKRGQLEEELAVGLLTKAIRSPVNFGNYNTEGLELPIDAARTYVQSYVKDKFKRAIERHSKRIQFQDFDVNIFDEDGTVDSYQTSNNVSIIDSVPGIGKTRAFIEEIIALLMTDSSIRIEILAHTHEKCKEIKALLMERMSNTVGIKLGQVIHRRGMSVDTCDNVGMKAMLTHEDGENKINQKFCRQCPLKTTCEYMKSNKDAKNAQILISTHAFARYKNTNDTPSEKMPIVIIDEDPLTSLAMNTVHLELSRGDGRLQEHKAIFQRACEDLYKLPNGANSLMGVSDAIKEAHELSAKLYKAWEASYDECVKVCKGDATHLFKLMTKAGITALPPVKSSFWGKIASDGVEILKTGDVLFIRTPPIFKRYRQGVDIIITDAKADMSLYKAMFPSSEISKSDFIEVPVDENASHFQIVETNYVNLKREQKKVMAESVEKVLEGKKSALISNKAVLKDINAEVSMNFTTAMGTNGLEQNELLVVIAWQRPPAFEMMLLAYNLYGASVMDNEWTSATENVLGRDVNRGHYPSNKDVQAVYNQTIRKPVYHAINRLRPIIPDRHTRTTILISNQFVSDKLVRKDPKELDIVYRLTDTAIIGKPEGYKSKTAWEYLIAQAVKDNGELQLKVSVIAEALNASLGALKKIGMKQITEWMTDNPDIEIQEREGSRADRKIKMLVYIGTESDEW